MVLNTSERFRPVIVSIAENTMGVAGELREHSVLNALKDLFLAGLQEQHTAGELRDIQRVEVTRSGDKNSAVIEFALPVKTDGIKRKIIARVGKQFPTHTHVEVAMGASAGDYWNNELLVTGNVPTLSDQRLKERFGKGLTALNSWNKTHLIHRHSYPTNETQAVVGK